MDLSWFKKNYIICLILFFALILRLYEWDKYAFAFYDEGVHAYFGVASSINPVLATMYQPPGLFLIEGLLYSLVNSVLVFRLLLIALSVLSIMLAFIWIKGDYSLSEALFVCFLLSITPIHILHSRFLNQDTLLFCLGLGALILVQLFAKQPKKKYLYFAGLFLGFGVFTKFTFLLFNIIIALYAFYIKKLSLKSYLKIIIGESAVILAFLLPLILIGLEQPNSIYSITNFFREYIAENIGESYLSLWTTVFYIGKSFVFLGPILIVLIYSLFTSKKISSKYSFLLCWIICSLFELSLSSKYFLRYFLMQNLAYIPILLFAANKLLSFNKKLLSLAILIILVSDFYYYYIFISQPIKIQEFDLFYVETDPFMETVDYLRNSINLSYSLLTNEPYLFLPLWSETYSANYKPHIICPDKTVKKLVLVNSSLGFYKFNYLNEVNSMSNYYVLDNVISKGTTTFYIYNVTSNSDCNMVYPLKRGLYLMDII